MTQQTEKKTARVATAKGEQVAANIEAQTEKVNAAKVNTGVMNAARASFVKGAVKSEQAHKDYAGALFGFVSSNGCKSISTLGQGETDPVRQQAFAMLQEELTALREALKEAGYSNPTVAIKRVKQYLNDIENPGQKRGKKETKHYDAVLVPELVALYKRSFRANEAGQVFSAKTVKALDGLEDLLKALGVNTEELATATPAKKAA